MQQIKCTKCNREVVTDQAAVRFSSTLGTKKHCIPQSCWSQGRHTCKEKEVQPDKK